MRPLRPHQEAGLVHVGDRKSAFWAMEMRLGKTLLTIRWLKKHMLAWDVIIVAPKTVLISWEDELIKEGIPFLNISGMTNKKRVEILSLARMGHNVFLINYEAFINDAVEEAITRNPPTALVLDESTAIKNPRSKTGAAMLRICDLVPVKACLSGYPAPETWTDIWAQMAFLNDGRWMGCSNIFKWIKDNGTKDTYGHFFTVSQQKRIKQAYQLEAYCLSRRDAGLGEEKIYQVRRGDLSRSDARLYAEIARSWAIPGRSISDQEQENETVYAMVVSQWLRRLCGGFLPGRSLDSWKYDELYSILLEHQRRKDAAIVWFAYTAEIGRARAHVVERGIPASRTATIYGSTNIEERRKIIHGFQQGRIDFIFIQQKIGRFGLDFSRASTAIYFSNAYSSELRVQSEDRIVMPGKPDPLLYVDFVTAGTIEEDIVHDLRHKKVNAKHLTNRITDLRRLALGGPRPGRNRVGEVARSHPRRFRIVQG